jgi:hypothetical protein
MPVINTCKNCKKDYPIMLSKAAASVFCGMPCKTLYYTPAPNLRRCGKCEEIKTVENFPLKTKGSEQRRSFCQPCDVARTRDWRANNKERCKIHNSTMYRKIMARRPNHRRDYSRDYNHRLRIEVLKAYGSRCVCCGEDTIEFLAFDHVDGGGNKHRKTIGSRGSKIYYWLRSHGFPNNFQILCHNCNMAKGFYGQCPHEKLKEKAA